MLTKFSNSYYALHIITNVGSSPGIGDVVQSRSLLTTSFHLSKLERVPVIEMIPSTVVTT